ncbi:hypothetical protein BH18VER1_BH18VER1_19890 [soil metagenome]
MSESNEPKKETVRITLPPRAVAKPYAAAAESSDTVHIDVATGPAPSGRAPALGAPRQSRAPMPPPPPKRVAPPPMARPPMPTPSSSPVVRPPKFTPPSGFRPPGAAPTAPRPPGAPMRPGLTSPDAANRPPPSLGSAPAGVPPAAPALRPAPPAASIPPPARPLPLAPAPPPSAAAKPPAAAVPEPFRVPAAPPAPKSPVPAVPQPSPPTPPALAAISPAPEAKTPPSAPRVLPRGAAPFGVSAAPSKYSGAGAEAGPKKETARISILPEPALAPPAPLKPSLTTPSSQPAGVPVIAKAPAAPVVSTGVDAIPMPLIWGAFVASAVTLIIQIWNYFSS